jgi:Raf kinase inhibitor-like YbhB/YbcL family protein
MGGQKNPTKGGQVLRLTGFIIALFLLSTAAWGGDAMTMTLESPVFAPGGEIPARYTGEGKDISPPLAFSGVPAAAKSLVLIIDDPDAPDPAAPKMTWVHWVLFNIPPAVKNLPEGIETLPQGTGEGINDFKRKTYGGPMPPVGRHRYFHKLYALDATLSFSSAPTKADVEKAMQGHIIASASLMGTYQLKR